MLAIRVSLCYNIRMIKSWAHKGLKRFFETGSLAGVQSDHKKRLKIILERLNAAVMPEDLELPGMNFHALLGKQKGFYVVKVSGNWRVIFKFDHCDVILVDYLDYH